MTETQAKHDRFAQQMDMTLACLGFSRKPSLAYIRSVIRSERFSHARQNSLGGQTAVLIYHRDDSSPTGVSLVLGTTPAIADPILRERHTSALSPTEGR